MSNDPDSRPDVTRRTQQGLQARSHALLKRYIAREVYADHSDA
jgi:hypothetical protein